MAKRKKINTRRKKARRKKLSEAQGGRCYWCGRDIVAEGLTLTLDHLVLPAEGGTWELSNLALSCDPCNNLRGNERAYDFRIDSEARMAWEGALA